MVRNFYKDHPPPTKEVNPKLWGVDEPLHVKIKSTNLGFVQLDSVYL